MISQVESQNPELFVQNRRHDSEEFIHITSGYGDLEAIYREDEGHFVINSVNVLPTYRKQGIGKAMIKKAVEEAKNHEAKVIISRIVSRECLDAMRSVFGDDPLSVSIEGKYQKPGEKDRTGSTSALLWYILKSTEVQV